MKLPGLHIQQPWAQLILNGVKTIETRHYPLPPKYLKKDLLVIETPGKSKEFEARIIGIVQFDDYFEYSSKLHFDSDLTKHHVADDSEFYWSTSKPKKWGWVVSKATKFKDHYKAPKKRGIIWTSEVSIQLF